MIGIIGGTGNIGSLIISALYNHGEREIALAARTPEKAELLKKQYDLEIYDIPILTKNCDVIFVCVKPQDFYHMPTYTTHKNTLIISVMAGVAINNIRKVFPEGQIVRTMPNLGGYVGKSMTVWYSEDNVEKEKVEKYIATFGEALEVSSEDDINKCTALTGSGPAYLYFFMATLIEKAQNMGFSTEESRKLMYAMIDGAFHFAKNNDLHPQELIEKVRSKGGTTEAALEIFESKQISKAIHQAIDAAYIRAQEISRITPSQQEE